MKKNEWLTEVEQVTELNSKQQTAKRKPQKNECCVEAEEVEHVMEL